jgi:hypothetical protein
MATEWKKNIYKVTYAFDRDTIVQDVIEGYDMVDVTQRLFQKFGEEGKNQRDLVGLSILNKTTADMLANEPEGAKQ